MEHIGTPLLAKLLAIHGSTVSHEQGKGTSATGRMQAPPQEDPAQKDVLNVANLKSNIDAVNYW